MKNLKCILAGVSFAIFVVNFNQENIFYCVTGGAFIFYVIIEEFLIEKNKDFPHSNMGIVFTIIALISFVFMITPMKNTITLSMFFMFISFLCLGIASVLASINEATKRLSESGIDEKIEWRNDVN